MEQKSEKNLRSRRDTSQSGTDNGNLPKGFLFSDLLICRRFLWPSLINVCATIETGLQVEAVAYRLEEEYDEEFDGLVVEIEYEENDACWEAGNL